jgi:hypothetical protein
MGDQPVARPLPTHDDTNRINAHRHPCLEGDSNQRSQCSIELRQFMLATVIGLPHINPYKSNNSYLNGL